MPTICAFNDIKMSLHHVISTFTFAGILAIHIAIFNYKRLIAEKWRFNKKTNGINLVRPEWFLNILCSSNHFFRKIILKKIYINHSQHLPWLLIWLILKVRAFRLTFHQRMILEKNHSFRLVIIFLPILNWINDA